MLMQVNTCGVYIMKQGTHDLLYRNTLCCAHFEGSRGMQVC